MTQWWSLRAIKPPFRERMAGVFAILVGARELCGLT